MSLRRRAVPVRLGAGLALATACALAPTAAFANPEVPDDGESTPAQEECQDAPPTISVSASEIQVGESISVSGSCFGESTSATIVVIGPEQTQTQARTSPTGEVSSDSFTFETPGEYTVQITADGQQANTSFEVLEPEDDDEDEGPEDPETDEPTDPEPEDPETEEPTDPEPEDPETDEPTDPEPEDPETEEPTDPEPEDPETDEPTEPAPGGEDEGTDDGEDQAGSGGGNTDDGNTGDGSTGDGDREQPEDSTSPTPPTNDFPGESQDDDEDGQPTAAQQPSPAEAPADPAPATRDFPSADAPSSGSPSTMHLQGSALAEALFGLAGSEAEASDGGGEDDELAETGIELSYGAAAATITLGAGATLLWTQRRRED